MVDPYSFSLAERSEDSHIVVLYYSKQPMCHGVATGQGDVIEIRVANMRVIDSKKEYGVDIDNDTLAFFTEAESYNSVIPDAAKLIGRPENTIPIVRIVKVNEYIGIAREPMKGYSIYIINDTDKIVEELDSIKPGFLQFYHARDKTYYTINAKLPVSEMLKIAESIP